MTETEAGVTRRQVRMAVYHRLRDGLGIMYTKAMDLTDGVMEELDFLGLAPREEDD